MPVRNCMAAFALGLVGPARLIRRLSRILPPRRSNRCRRLRPQKAATPYVLLSANWAGPPTTTAEGRATRAMADGELRT